MRKVAWFALLAGLFASALLIEQCVMRPSPGSPAAVESDVKTARATTETDDDVLVLTLGGDLPRTDRRHLGAAPATASGEPASDPVEPPDVGHGSGGPAPPQPSSHRLVPGETIESVSRAVYGSDLYALHLRELNGLPPTTVAAGTTLRLPPRSTLERRYRVQRGDTLSQLAQKLLGTTRRTTELAALNGLENANDIHENQVLRLPPP